MTIDAFGEKVLSLAEAVKRLPKSRVGKRLHCSVIFRWAQRGLKSYDGQIVRLETIKIGGRAFTSLEALQRFFERLSRSMVSIAPPVRTYRERKRAIQKPEEELRRAGIL